MKTLAFARTYPGSFFLRVLVFLAMALTVVSVLGLLAYLLVLGIPHLKLSLFAFTYNSVNVSLMPALLNTVLMIIGALVLSLPIGIGSAIYLTEYAKSGSKLVSVIRVTTETLAGIPSIVYGLFGALLFVKYLHFGLSVGAGCFTLAIMILPLIMRTTEEALLTVDPGYKAGSYALGAGQVHTIFKVILPSATPGILAGVILSIGRIIGESAALIFTAGTIPKLATSFFNSGRTLAVHMYALSEEGLHIDETYATAVVLIVLVIIINAISSALAKRVDPTCERKKTKTHK